MIDPPMCAMAFNSFVGITMNMDQQIPLKPCKLSNPICVPWKPKRIIKAMILLAKGILGSPNFHEGTKGFP